MRILVNAWTFLGTTIRVDVMGDDPENPGGPLTLTMSATLPIDPHADPHDIRDLVAVVGEAVIELAYRERPGLGDRG